MSSCPQVSVLLKYVSQLNRYLKNINRLIELCGSQNMLNLLNQGKRPVRDAVRAVHWTVMLLHSIGSSEHWPLDYDTINQVIDTAQAGCQKGHFLLLDVSASVVHRLASAFPPVSPGQSLFVHSRYLWCRMLTPPANLNCLNSGVFHHLYRVDIVGGD